MEKDITHNKTSNDANDKEPSFAETVTKINDDTEASTFDEVIHAKYNEDFYKTLEKYGLNLDELKDLPVKDAFVKSAESDAYRKYVVGTFKKWSERYLNDQLRRVFNMLMGKITFTDNTTIKRLDVHEVKQLMYLCILMCSLYIEEHPDMHEHHEFVTVFMNMVTLASHSIL